MTAVYEGTSAGLHVLALALAGADGAGPFDDRAALCAPIHFALETLDVFAGRRCFPSRAELPLQLLEIGPKVGGVLMAALRAARRAFRI